MASSSSIEQQHQEFKRQISAHETFPCFLLDQTFQQRFSSPSTNTVPSFLSAQTLSPMARTPMTNNVTTTQGRLSAKSSNQYRLFPSSPSNISNPTRTNPSNQRSSGQLVDVPIEKTIVPLRTLPDVFPSYSYTMMKTKRNQSRFEPLRVPEKNSTSNLTVSIFGFRDEDFETMIRQFQDIGPVQHIERPVGCENGNFIHITYTNNVSCQNALNRDGMICNGHMIGVVPFHGK